MPNQETKDWRSSLFGCCAYRAPPDSTFMAVPYFLPMSLCGTCCIIGRIFTLLNDEEPLCCEMGPSGWFYCFFSNACLGPPGFMLLGCFLRNRIMGEYNVFDNGFEQCGACCYPCSYFQMFASLKEWKAERDTIKRSSQPSAPPLPVATPMDSPIVYENPVIDRRAKNLP